MRTSLRSRIALQIILYAAISIVLDGCGGASQTKSVRRVRRTFATAMNRPICLVLSVGDVKGLAHVGAIQAVKNAGLNIRYVVGNSMGALVGSMYATAPNEDIRKRYQAYIDAYVKETENDKASGTFGGFLFGVLS